MKKILYIVPHRLNRSPGQRFRCEHFIPWLKKHNYEITYANLLTAWDDYHFYKRRNYFLKTFILIKSYIKRIQHVRKAGQYDAVFIYREAFMLGTTNFEKRIFNQKVPIIYDFDDAIWLNDVSEANKNLKWLKRPDKTGDICQMASLVIVGNQYLAQYAKQFCNHVEVIPTTIDTQYHIANDARNDNDFVRIGWTGSSTTLKHLKILLPVLKIIKEKYGAKVKIRAIADEPLIYDGFEIENIRWNAHDEVERLDEIDIGIMPLPDDQWSKGKCGFKGLQYMAMKIPAIMSPVGVNTEIIEHGVNGFLASTPEEWKKIISTLIDNANLRKEIGLKGRQTICEKYSINAQKEKYLQLFDSITNR